MENPSREWVHKSRIGGVELEQQMTKNDKQINPLRLPPKSERYMSWFEFENSEGERCMVEAGWGAPAWVDFRDEIAPSQNVDTYMSYLSLQ